MTILKNSGRQEVIALVVDFDLADITPDGSFPAIDLPVGAIVTGGNLQVTTAFDSVTTAAMNVGDASVANRYIAAANLKSLGANPVVPTGFVVTSATTEILLAIAQTGGDATEGAARLTLQYVVVGRAGFSQG